MIPSCLFSDHCYATNTQPNYFEAPYFVNPGHVTLVPSINIINNPTIQMSHYLEIMIYLYLFSDHSFTTNSQPNYFETPGMFVIIL